MEPLAANTCSGSTPWWAAIASRSAAVGAVGVAVPVDVGRRSAASASAKPAGRRLGRLVGVEADGDVDLGRVVALHEREVVARRGRVTAGPAAGGSTRRGRRGPRSVGERDRRAAPPRRAPPASTRHDVDVLEEVVDPERAGEAGRAVGGQHVVGPGEVVADRRRRVGAAEHGAGVAHERQQRLGVGDEQLEVLGGDGVGDVDGLLGSVAQHRVAALGEGGLEVLRGGASAARSRRPPRRRASATASSQVMSQARPSGPCSAWSDDVDGGPARPAWRRRRPPRPRTGRRTRDGTPTSPADATSRLACATQALPGPTMTSTGRIDSVP